MAELHVPFDVRNDQDLSTKRQLEKAAKTARTTRPAINVSLMSLYHDWQCCRGCI